MEIERLGDLSVNGSTELSAQKTRTSLSLRRHVDGCGDNHLASSPGGRSKQEPGHNSLRCFWNLRT
jgi:hypothetical protein